MATDHSTMKLGKKAAKHDPRRLKLGNYLQPLGDPPATRDWTIGGANYGMMLNDSLGDCTIAGCAHAIQICSAAVGQEVTVSDDVVLQYYEKWDGYDPANPDYTDQGGVEPDVLNDWRRDTFDGHELLAYCDPDPGNAVHVKWGINLFGGLYIGLQLPASAQNQGVWDVADGPDGEPGSWGGHCVFVPAYTPDHLLCITWGQIKAMTWAFWQKYCDESHALLLKDFINANDQTADGIDLDALQADLKAVTA